MRQTGLDESHILCVIANDNECLIIHEKFKQNYIVLERVIFIQNDPFSPGLKKEIGYTFGIICGLLEKRISSKIMIFH